MPATKNPMLVSKNFYASLVVRIESSFDKVTAAQLVALVNDRVEGREPCLDGCSDTVRMFFTFILADIEKAIVRSARCREAARRRKEAKPAAKPVTAGDSGAKPREIVIGDLDKDHELVLVIPPPSRAERRRREREARRKHRRMANKKEKP